MARPPSSYMVRHSCLIVLARFNFNTPHVRIGYVPSEALGLAAVVLFGLLLMAHLFHLVRWRGTRSFQVLFIIGCLMELVGYGFRLASHFKPFVVIDFILAYVLIVCVCSLAFSLPSKLIEMMNRHPYYSLLRYTSRWAPWLLALAGSHFLCHRKPSSVVSAVDCVL